MAQNMDEKVEKSQLSLKEEEILKSWKENKIFQKTLEKSSPEGEYVFYEGPPTANGRPGIHHLESRAFKDIIPRFKTMRGYHVSRKAGWDTHGLPVELEVEKQLGLKSKKEIESYGIAEFNEKCRENVWKYVDEWERFTERIGYSVDLENPYVTYKPEYIEAIWKILSKVNKDKLIYKDYKVVPWCPRCGTALSSHELAQGYETVKDLSVYVKLKAKETDDYFLVWTTTPWTLPGNIALAVGVDVDYVKVSVEGEKIWLAKERAKIILPEAEVIEEVTGADLIGRKYEPLYPYLSQLLSPSEIEKLENSFQIYPADFVTTEDGSGIVHTAVMYGQDDFELGTKNNLPKFHLVDDTGHFISGTGDLEGKFVRDEETAVHIVKDLAHRNLLFKKEKYEHTYPFCWRCHTALIYYARDSWYIKMSALRDKLVKENEKINWEPAHIKEGRFGEWLREVKDWAISRERYWGTPLPIWVAKDGEVLFVDSYETLEKYSKKTGEVFALRHGEAEHNVKRIVSSKAENPHHLTDAGKEEIATAALKLKDKNITKIFVSPFVRTRETAEIVREKLGLPAEAVIVDERLKEYDFGNLNNKDVSEIRKIYPNFSDRFTIRAEGGENLNDVRERITSFCKEVLKNSEENVLIISHEIPIWILNGYASASDTKYLLKQAEEEVSEKDFVQLGEILNLKIKNLPRNKLGELDPHRPFIDEVLLEKDGKGFLRVKEVLDVWFDSGAMPFAQYAGESENFPYPADYISEAIDQTRGWFYTLHAIGNLMERGASYKNVICLGHILDEKGQKMSKSKGNVVSPWDMADKYGVDPLRFWMYSVNQPGDSKNFDEKTVDEVVKKVFNLLLNTVNFYEMYSLEKGNISASENVLDIWIMARTKMLNINVSKNLDNYKIFEASRLIREYISDLSQWYVRRSRDRFRSDEEKDRTEALFTLRSVLLEVSKILAPFTPFLAEDIYRRVGGEKLSVHLEDWSNYDSISRSEEENVSYMEEVRRLVSLALLERSKANIRVRQPLSSLKIKTSEITLPNEFLEIIKDEVNVKTVEYEESQSEEVKLDTVVTEELKEEGDIRELIRAVQDWRKEKGLTPREKTPIKITVNENSREMLGKYEEEVKRAGSLSEIQVEVGEPDGNWFKIN